MWHRFFIVMKKIEWYLSIPAGERESRKLRVMTRTVNLTFYVRKRSLTPFSVAKIRQLYRWKSAKFNNPFVSFLRPIVKCSMWKILIMVCLDKVKASFPRPVFFSFLRLTMKQIMPLKNIKDYYKHFYDN